MSRVIVIGAGLFGSIIAKRLRAVGHEVTVFADQRPLMGSVPAACLMKPGWASKMSRKEFEDAINLLGVHYGVEKISFELRPTPARADVWWVDPAKVLRAPDRVLKIRHCFPTQPHQRRQPELDRWAVSGIAPLADGTFPTNTLDQKWWCQLADHVVSAQGFWSVKTDPALQGKLRAQGGWAFRWPGRKIDPFIQPWAPYKQLVGFNIGGFEDSYTRRDEAWVGDGSALLPESLTEERRLASLDRCARAAGLPPSEATCLTGYRPYVKGLDRPAYVNTVEPGWHVVTGGAKNGTLGAAWAAREIEKRIS